MKIKVNAEIILQVPETKYSELAEGIALEVERKLNLDSGVLMTPRGTRVGVRFHFKSAKEVL